MEVTQTGVEYSSAASSPLKGLASGEAAYIINTVIWISGEKLLTNQGYNYLIVKVGPPETCNLMDLVTANDFLALPVTISTYTSARKFPTTGVFCLLLSQSKFMPALESVS